MGCKRRKILLTTIHGKGQTFQRCFLRDELAVLGQRLGKIRADVHVVWPARAGQWSTEVVVRSIEAAISQGYDGIVVCPVFDGTAGIIDDAVATGFPVITMIAEGQAPSKRMTYVGQNNRAAAVELGKLVAEKWAVRASWALSRVTSVLAGTRNAWVVRSIV